jgi:stearoyl-CoA desaturase (delta-9 desaturase)
MITKQWVAIHRKHHAFSDQEGDPHSPHVFGIWRVFTQGAGLYSQAAKDTEMVDKFGVGTPDDWIERNLYTPWNFLGILLMLVIDCLFFGPWGLLVWGIQMIWIPLWAAGVINGIGHWWGYRNTETRDQSRNISPWGIIIGGEELHNNHHMNPARPKLSLKWYEFDIGWMWLRLFSLVGLAEIVRLDTV